MNEEAAVMETPSGQAPSAVDADGPAPGYARIDGITAAEFASPSPPGAVGHDARRRTPGFLLDVRLTVSAEVGRVQMPVREIMELGPGSVIDFPQRASEPVEIYANGRVIGRGEIVVVGEQFGVRITELADRDL